MGTRHGGSIGRVRLGGFALLVVLALMCAAAGGAWANSESSNVAIVPTATGEAGNGGELPTSNFPGGYNPSFTTVPPEDVQDESIPDPIAGFDTVVLAQLCSIDARLTDVSFKSRIESFVANGGKLLIWDSECTGTDYSKFIFPFTTDNPGAAG